MADSDFGSVSAFADAAPDPNAENAFNAVFGGAAGAASGATPPNNSSLFAALAGDATKVATAFIAADAAKHVVKANPNSATTLIIVAGGIAALVLVLVLVRK